MNEKQLTAFFDMLEKCGKENDDKRGIFIEYKDYWRIANKLGTLLPTLGLPLCDFPDRVISGETVMEIINMARTTLYRLIKDGKFPQSITVPGFEKSPGWRLSDIMNWLESPEIWNISNQVAAITEQDLMENNEI